MTAQPVAPAHTEHSISQALYRHFMPAWAPLVHIAADRTYDGDKAPRIIDMLLVRRARKKGIGPLDLLAIEIKVTRSDFLADVRDPRKQAAWRTIAHRHAYAVPTGLVKPDELPDGSGLIEVNPWTQHLYRPAVSWKVRAKYSDTPPTPTSILLTFAYRAARAEAQIRGLSGETSGHTDPDEMRAELVRLRAELDKTGAQRDRLADERNLWRSMFAATGEGIPCGDCGRPVKPSAVRSGWASKWKHVDHADEDPCAKLRQAAAEDRARADWEALDDWTRQRRMSYAAETGNADAPWLAHVWVPDVEPGELAPDGAA